MTNRNTLVTAAVLLTVFLAGGLVGAAVSSTVTSAADTAARGGPADGAEQDEQEPAPAGDPSEEAGRDGGDASDHGDRRDGRRRGPDYAVSRLLHEELDLDADQERRVEAVLKRRRERAHAIFGETKERLRSQFDSTVDELEQVLTDEQAARFDTLLDRLKERRGWDEKGEDGHDAPPADDGRP